MTQNRYIAPAKSTVDDCGRLTAQLVRGGHIARANCIHAITGWQIVFHVAPSGAALMPDDGYADALRHAIEAQGPLGARALGMPKTMHRRVFRTLSRAGLCIMGGRGAMPVWKSTLDQRREWYASNIA